MLLIMHVRIKSVNKVVFLGLGLSGQHYKINVKWEVVKCFFQYFTFILMKPSDQKLTFLNDANRDEESLRR